MIEIREAKVEDATDMARLYREVWDGKYPYAKFTEESEIERMLREDECLWIVGIDEGRFFGAVACIHNKWNNSTEFGRGVLRKEYRSKHIGMETSGKLVEAAFEKGFDICWGTPRNTPVYYIVTNLGFQTTGYMPGPYAVDFREVYLFSMKLAGKCIEKRVTPISKGEFYNAPLFKSTDSALTLKDNPGEYPDIFFAGDPKKASSSIKFNFFEEPHGSLFVVSLDEGLKKIRYIEGDILADKREFISQMERLGFRITAYMPAWYEQEGKRFDCVKMVREFEKCSSHDGFIDEIKNKLERELEY